MQVAIEINRNEQFHGYITTTVPADADEIAHLLATMRQADQGLHLMFANVTLPDLVNYYRAAVKNMLELDPPKYVSGKWVERGTGRIADFIIWKRPSRNKPATTKDTITDPTTTEPPTTKKTILLPKGMI